MPNALILVIDAAEKALDVGLQAPIYYYAECHGGTVTVGEIVVEDEHIKNHTLRGFMPNEDGGATPIRVVFVGSNNAIAEYRIDAAPPEVGDEKFVISMVRKSGGALWSGSGN